MSLFKNRTVVGVICILLSLLICFGVTPLFNQSVSQKTEIVRVVKEIKAGEEVTREMVQTVEVGGFGLPDNVLRQSESVVGKYATADLSVGDYILNTKLSDTPAAENTYLYNLDGTKQAISVTIKSFANGLSGKLQSGDIVSVIAPDYKKQGSTVIPAELKYVEVIAVTAGSGYDANQRDAGPNSPSASDERELPAVRLLHHLQPRHPYSGRRTQTRAAPHHAQPVGKRRWTLHQSRERGWPHDAVPPAWRCINRGRDRQSDEQALSHRRPRELR